MWKEKKTKTNNPTEFQCKTILHVDILELIGSCIMSICSGSTKIALLTALLHLVIILVAVISLCHAAVGSHGWEKARWSFPKICSVILVRGSLDKLKISQMLFPSQK